MLWCLLLPAAAGLAYFYTQRVRLLAKIPQDEFYRQAHSQQARADYPGCPLGLMQCRSLCECLRAGTPSLQWVSSRAAQLRGQAECGHQYTTPWSSEIFPEFVSGQQCVNCRAVRRTGENEWEAQN